MACAYSSTVFTLSSARELRGSSNSRPAEAIRNLRGHLRPAAMYVSSGARAAARKLVLALLASLLVLGPSVPKLHFVKFAHEHNRALSDHIVGVETADHPTDKQIVAHVRHYFHREDRRIPMAT